MPSVAVIVAPQCYHRRPHAAAAALVEVKVEEVLAALAKEQAEKSKQRGAAPAIVGVIPATQPTNAPYDLATDLEGLDVAMEADEAAFPAAVDAEWAARTAKLAKLHATQKKDEA